MVSSSRADSPTHRVFRSRAVVVVGVVQSVVGLVLGTAGVVFASLGGPPRALPLGLVICVLGLLLLVTGFARMNARMELGPTEVTWTWSFSRQRLALDDVVDCALVEKGSPASGGAWSGFLGGGLVMVLVWWLVDVAAAFARSEPSLGSLELVAVKRYGGPVPIRPISAWSTPASRSQANQALQALQAARHVAPRRAPQELPILRHDAWGPTDPG